MILRDAETIVLKDSKQARFFHRCYVVIQFHNLQIADIPIAEGKVIDCI